MIWRTGQLWISFMNFSLFTLWRKWNWWNFFKFFLPQYSNFYLQLNYFPFFQHFWTWKNFINFEEIYFWLLENNFCFFFKEPYLARIIYELTEPEDVIRLQVIQLINHQKSYKKPQKHITALLSWVFEKQNIKNII